MNVGYYSFEEFLELVKNFHGYPAPGVILGGYMVAKAQERIPDGVLYDAISETSWCLPDSIQILTPCTTGNGWLKISNLGLYALSLYDKYDGKGTRVYLDPSKLDQYPGIGDWYLKRKPKREQDTSALLEEIEKAGDSIYSVTDIAVRPEYYRRREKGHIGVCPVCGEAYPLRDGGICRSCQGESPYADGLSGYIPTLAISGSPAINPTPVEEAVGKKVLHDITRIEPGVSKGAEFRKGQEITAGDLCRLHQMGRFSVYTEGAEPPGDEWVHENEVADKFAEAMAGEGVDLSGPPHEGKIDMIAARDGLFVVNEERLESFNLVPDVMAASRHGYSVVKKGAKLAGTRAIPLYLAREIFQNALSVLEEGPLFKVLPMRRAKVGILVTGTEIFQGLIEDRFENIISGKIQNLGCSVEKIEIVPDDMESVKNGVKSLLDAGSDLIVTTAGLSVDPDDVTRQGLIDAGINDMVYGAPILPGAMTLLGRIGAVQVFGVPACALYFKTTSFDLILPRLLAGLRVTRRDLAKMGHGAYCHTCKSCTYPKCSFGK